MIDLPPKPIRRNPLDELFNKSSGYRRPLPQARQPEPPVPSRQPEPTHKRFIVEEKKEDTPPVSESAPEKAKAPQRGPRRRKKSEKKPVVKYDNLKLIEYACTQSDVESIDFENPEQYGLELMGRMLAQLLPYLDKIEKITVTFKESD